MKEEKKRYVIASLDFTTHRTKLEDTFVAGLRGMRKYARKRRKVNADEVIWVFMPTGSKTGRVVVYENGAYRSYKVNAQGERKS